MPVTLQLVVPTAIPLPPRLLLHVTLLKATSSVRLPHIDNTLLLVDRFAADVGTVIVIVGGVVSGGGREVTISVSLLLLFAASRAVTVRTFVPSCSETAGTLQLVVPLAMPLPPRSLLQVTWTTPTLSVAAPVSDITLVKIEKFGSEVGLVIVTPGALV